METVILDLGAGTVRHGDRVARVPPVAARFLRGLTLCGDGCLADHIVGRPRRSIHLTRVWPLRTAFRTLGLSYSIERVRYGGIAGYRLPASLRVLVVEDHPHASTIAATTTQPSATAPATSTTRIDHSSSLSSLRRASVSSSGAHASTGDVQSIGAHTSISSALLLVGDEQGEAKSCETIRAKTETLGANQ